MKSATPPDKPNLEKESIAFSAVTGVGWGALFGAAIMPIFNKIHGTPLATGVVESMIVVGALNGMLSASDSLIRNRQKAATKPYIERLENELEIKNAALNGILTR